MSQSLATDWLAFSRPSPKARLRLFCFPYAGLGASVYRSWTGGLGGEVDICPVQLPGRESRQLEPPFTAMAELLDALAAALEPYLDRPFALFGHSMGALIAFELARRVHRNRALTRLFVSARRAPHLRESLEPISGLPADAFASAVQSRYGGIPDAVRACPELMDLLLPRLRADFTVLERYVCEPGEALSCGISVFAGRQDTTVSEPTLQAWQRHTRADVRLRLLDAGHLYLQDQRDTLVAAIGEDLASAVALREATA